MYAHPVTSPVLASPTSPTAWRQAYVPQQMPVLNQAPLHVRHLSVSVSFFRSFTLAELTVYCCFACTMLICSLVAVSTFEN